MSKPEFKRTKHGARLVIYGQNRRGGARISVTSEVFGKQTETAIELAPCDVRALYAALMKWATTGGGR